MPEYQGRVRFRIRPFPLEVTGGEAAPRDILEQEWWLAALQEPKARFVPFQGDEWPTTTLPAFEAVWCATQHNADLAHRYDLRIRQAFFAESRNIGRRDVLLALAEEVGLAMAPLVRTFDSGVARAAVLEDCGEGRSSTVCAAQGSSRFPLHICGMKPTVSSACNFTAEVAVLFTLYVA